MCSKGLIQVEAAAKRATTTAGASKSFAIQPARRHKQERKSRY